MKNSNKEFVSQDGTPWLVVVQSPGASNAMVLFRHPDPASSSNDRYAWYQWKGAEAAAVRTRLKPQDVLARLTDADLKMLFRRSMPVQSTQPRITLLNR